MPLQVRAKFGKRPFEHKLILENLAVDLRQKVKDTLRLQVPKTHLVITIDGVEIRTQDDLRKLKHNDLLHVTIREFEVGIPHMLPFLKKLGDYIITREELGNGSFAQAISGTSWF